MDRYHAGKNVVPVSVNLSWMDFYDEKIMEDILDKCKNNDLEEKLIRLEVTETSYAAMGESRNSILESFRTEGVKIMMDDFGTGYSSFGMLQQYNFDIMKIDMSFIRQIETNPKTKSMLRFLIDMAHEMGIHIVAEGVETEVQADFLRRATVIISRDIIITVRSHRKSFENFSMRCKDFLTCNSKIAMLYLK